MVVRPSHKLMHIMKHSDIPLRVTYEWVGAVLQALADLRDIYNARRVNPDLVLSGLA